MWFVLGAIAVMASLYLVHRLGLYADRRGWLYYKTKPPHGAGSMAVMRVTSILDPTIEHVIEEIESERIVMDESGQPWREEE